MTTITAEAHLKINLFDLFDEAELTDTQRDLAYEIYDLTRQIARKLDDMAKDIAQAQNRLAQAVSQFLPSAVSPQAPMELAILNTKLEAAHVAALQGGVSQDLRVSVTTAALQ